MRKRKEEREREMEALLDHQPTSARNNRGRASTKKEGVKSDFFNNNIVPRIIISTIGTTEKGISFSIK